VTGSHTPGLHLHPSYPGGVLVDLEPLSWGNYTDAVLVYYPSLLSRLVRVSPAGLRPLAALLPEEEQEQIIDTALAAWQVVR
jgi:hypothetical protein